MNPDLKAMSAALRGLTRLHGVWVALFMAMLFLAAPGAARAQATCAIDFSVTYNATNYAHVMSMTENFDEFASCDPRYIANPGDPASGFTPYVQTGSTANGGSFVTAVNAADDTIRYTAPTGFSGVDTFVVYFCNDAGCSGAGARVGTVFVTVGTPTIAVNPTSLPPATVAAAYSQTLTGSGGQAPYGAFTVISGALPAGLTLSAGGALTGTPTASGSFNFTVRTTDSSTGNGPFQGSRAYTMTVNAPTVTVSPTTLPAATVGSAYSQAVAGAGGTAPYQAFVVTVGALPPGLSLNGATGALTGTPTAGGSFNFTIRTTDSTTGSGPFNGSRAYAMTVNAPTISVGPVTLPSGDQGSTYSQTITATGGTAPRDFTVTAGALPAGLTLAAGGALTGTPTVNGNFNFTVTATDSSTGTGPYTGSRAYTLVINAPPAPVANAVSQTVAYNSTATPITLNITGGAATSVATPGLPTHGTVSVVGTTITYTPTTNYGGPDSFTYTATNAGGTSSAATVTITVSAPTITISPATLPGGVTGVAYSQAVSAAGGSGTYAYTLTAGSPPAGLTLSTAGVLSGTPTGTGPYNFTVTATDTSTGNGPYTGARAYSVTIATPNPPIANPASVTVAYNSVNNPITLSITGGTPTSLGLISAPSNGVVNITGTSITYSPMTGYSGSDSFTYTATNADGTSAPATVSITVDPEPPVAGPVSATVAQDSSNNPITLNITGGSPTTLATPALPSHGLVAIAGTSITYTPSAGYFGTDNFTYTATNAGGTSAPATVSITINPAPPVASASTLTVAFESINNPVPLDLTGGPATSVGLVSAPSNGVVNLTGTSITYSPMTGYFGSDSFTYTATNAGGTSAPATVTVTVNPPAAPVAGAVALSVAANSSANPVTLSLSGGTATSVATPSLPTHGTVSVAGTTITYTPTAGYSGADSFTYTATNPGGTSAPATVTVTVTPPTLTLSALTTTGQVTAAYSDTVAATLGTAPYAYAVTAGALPAGLSLSGGGLLSGTPTAPGGYNFTVTATDAWGAVGSRAYAITISAPTVAITSPAAGALPSVEAWTAFSQSFTATGGVGPHTFVVSAGALPPGLGLSAGGALTGTPTTPGTYNFSVTPSDSSASPGPYPGPPVAYSITVTAPVIVLTPAAGALTARTTALAFTETFSATGGVGPYSYTISAGALPPGVSLTGGGVLSGAPTAAGSYNFTVSAEDSHAFSVANAYSLVVTDPVVTVTTPSAGALPSVEAYGAYSETFASTGGVGPRSYAIVAGGLPPGLTLSSGGLLSGTPTTPGTYTFSVAASDSSGAPGPFISAPVAYSITVNAPVIVLTPAAGALTGRTTALAFTESFSATGGVGPYSYSLTAGALPPGVSLSSGGLLSGTPTAAGTFNFTVMGEDSHAFSAANAYSLTVSDPVVTMTTLFVGGLPGATAYAAYNQAFSATGGTGPYSFSLAAGALPPGMSLSSGGVLSGAPTAAGTFNFSIAASDSSGAPGPFTSAPVAYSLVVAAPTVTIASPATGALPNATATVSYSQAFTATGGDGSHTFAVVAGALPPGLGLSATGVLSGLPTAPGTYSFDLVASDNSGAPGPYSSAPVAYSLTVAAPTVTITAPAAGALPGVIAFQPVNQTFTATGGLGPRTFAVVAGALPPGVGLSAAGVLSGAPTATGTYNFSVVASDSSSAPGPFASTPVAYSLAVSAPTLVVTPTSLPDGTTGAAYALALSASGGTAPYGYSVTAGALPAGLALTAGGSLSGTPTAAGTFGFTVTVTDANGFTAARPYSLVIIDAAPVAAPDAAGTPANQAVAIPVTANDAGVITSIAMAAAPAHGAAVVSGLTVTYTPATDYFGPDSFTYTATGPGGTSAPATVSVTVTPLAVPTAAPRAITVLAGQSGSVDAAAGSTGAPITGVAIAAAPAHGSATVSGQSLVYTPAAGYSGADSFTYTLSNPFGTSAPAMVTVTVNPAPITAAPITVEILAGQTASVNLTADAVGGPFTGAALVSLTPSSAGEATITDLAAGQYGLTFTPAADFAGTVTATYTLSNAFATSAAGTVTVIVTARPDPAVDPEVTGLIAAQSESARRFATAQISNINGRLESLRDGGGAGASLRLNFSGGSRDLALDNDPLRRRLGDDEWTDVLPGLSYGAGLAGQAAAERATGTDVATTSGRFGLWAAGGIDFGQRDATTGQQGVEFETDGLTAGADMRISDRLVLGASVGWGHDESRVGQDGTRSDADGYSYTVYGSYQPEGRFFVDGLLGYGTLDFDSRRYISASGDFAYGQRDGSQWFGAVTGGWDLRDGRRLLSPYGRLSATRSELGAYAETTGGPYALAYESQMARTLTGALGLRGAWSHLTSFGELVPRFRVEYSHDFQGADRANLFYVDWVDGPVYGVDVDPLDQDRALAGVGLELLARGGARLSFEYETVIGGGGEQHQIRLGLQTRF